MKTISFSVVKILPHLLDRTKGQTIRPAWYYPKSWAGMMASAGTKMLDKPPYLKVEEDVRLYWKQRVKAKFFNISDGKANPTYGRTDNFPESETRKKGVFSKILGTGVITEVFEIEMVSHKDGYAVILGGKEYHWKIGGVWDDYLQDLAKRDGFDSVAEMFKKFDEMYDLSVPKRFYVYRWRWDK